MKTKVNVMKKVLGFVLTLVIMCSMLPMTSNAAEESAAKFYLNANSWDVDGAWFAAWCWGSTTGASDSWIQAPREKNDKGYYVFENPNGYTSAIFVRLDPKYTEPGWEKDAPLWNRRDNITLPTSTSGCLYTVTGWGESDGTWSHVDENSNGACDLCDAYIDGMSAVAGHSLTLDGEIGVVFHMELADDVAEDAYMQFTHPDGSTSQMAKGEAVDGVYEFTCKVAAKEMAGTIRAQMVSDGKIGTEYTYSVKTYANDILADNERSTELKAFVEAMLNYGAASQTQFGFETSNLANAGIVAGEIHDAGDLVGFQATVTDKNDILSNIKANLVLESETTMNIKFTTADGATINGASATGTEHVVPVANINASNLDTISTVTVEVGGNTAEIKCSPLSYCYSVLANNEASDNLKKVVSALYDYNVAADEYVDSLSN